MVALNKIEFLEVYFGQRKEVFVNIEDEVCQKEKDKGNGSVEKSIEECSKSKMFRAPKRKCMKNRV